jgi:hypothetical protein
VSERVLQALLGHRDARSTRRYARLAEGRWSTQFGLVVDPMWIHCETGSRRSSKIR